MGRFIIDTGTKANDFILSLDKIRKARVDRIYYLFEEYGSHLPNKYLKKLRGNLWELRPGDVRLLLMIKGNRGLVLHAFYKKSQKTPKKDLELALKRMKGGS